MKNEKAKGEGNMLLQQIELVEARAAATAGASALSYQQKID